MPGLRRLIVLLAASVLTGSCVSVKPIYYDEDKVTARGKVHQLHELYNRETFSDIYDMLSDRLKNEQTREQFIASLTRLKADNGRFLQSQETKIQVIPQAATREVDIRFSSEYEKGWCDEGFALFVDGKESVIDVLMINPSKGPSQPER